MSKEILFPLGTAVWLIENTKLTFQQIAQLCSLHIKEVESIADGYMANNIKAQDPILNGQLTKEEIQRCELNSDLTLQSSDPANKLLKRKNKTYVPLIKRKNKPDCILWIVKNYPSVPDAKIAKLVSSTTSTVLKIREKTHWNIENITPKDPVICGICTQSELNALIEKFAPNEQD